MGLRIGKIPIKKKFFPGFLIEKIVVKYESLKLLENDYLKVIDEASQLLSPYDCGWNDGGCHILAQGIELWAAQSAQPVERRCLVRESAHTRICDHWFVRINKEVIDGDDFMEWAIDGEGIHAANKFRVQYYRAMGPSITQGYATLEDGAEVAPHPETPVDLNIAQHLSERLHAWMPFSCFMATLPVPERVTLGDFLCDAEGPDPWCNQSFNDYIKDIDTEPDPETLVSINNEYIIGYSSDAVLLIERSSNDVVGYYCAGAVCIEDDHQGQGLSTPLILAAYDFFGGPPTSMLDEQMFSKAGYAAHCAAWRYAVEKGIFIERGLDSFLGEKCIPVLRRP